VDEVQRNEQNLSGFVNLFWHFRGNQYVFPQSLYQLAYLSLRAHAFYYTIIAHPISMAMIKTHMNAPHAGYTNLASFVADWRLMFTNAREIIWTTLPFPPPL
jgi:hypothetical protein